MRKVLLFGCVPVLGLGGLLLVALVAVGTSTRRPATPQMSGELAGATQEKRPAKTELAAIGQTVALRGWEVTLLDFGPYERFAPGKVPATKAQGVLLVADLRVKNLQSSTSNFTTGDFRLLAADGREFRPAGQTATVERGFVVSQTVQPGLMTENRVVFDVDPAVKDFVFTALGTQFTVTAP